MTYKPRTSAALLLSVLLLTACGSFKPPSTGQIQLPEPPAELMEPEDSNGSYLDSVQILLQNWLSRLTDWKEKS